MNRTYHRGDMYYGRFGPGNRFRGRKAIRPVLIIQTILETSTAPRSLWRPYPAKWTPGQAAHPLSSQSRERPGAASLVLMEQLRTIDKRRLETYIGHLEEQHIRRLNRALAVSVGLIEETPKNLIMCLCPACANNFYGTALIICAGSTLAGGGKRTSAPTGGQRPVLIMK